MEHQLCMNNCSIDWCVCLPSILHFTFWASFLLVFFLFHWSPPIPIPISVLLENLTVIVLIDCLNECNKNLFRHLICTDHLHAYNRLLKMGMISQKKIHRLCGLNITSKKTPIFKTKRFIKYRTLYKTSEVNWLKIIDLVVSSLLDPPFWRVDMVQSLQGYKNTPRSKRSCRAWKH